MPLTDKHNEKYVHNKRLLNNSNFRNAFSDWFVTVLFYGAVHLVERELTAYNHHSKTHNDRRMWVARTPSLKEVSAAYESLYIQSRRARYECVKMTSQDVEKAEELFEKIETHLNTKTSVTQEK